MGLDLVELVIRIEDTFEITIPDNVATQLTTPGKVIDFIFSQVETSNEFSCLSQQSFYFLRERFVPFLNLPRKDFRPKTQLESLFPIENRKLVWERLKTEIGDSVLPELARPVWLVLFLTLLTIVVSIYSFIYLRWNYDFGIGISSFSALLISITFGYVSGILTTPLKQHFRRNHKQVGDIAKYLILHKPQSFKKERKNWTREQIAVVVREIIIEETGVTEFTEDSDFINDMHLD
jgi:hypothetical protein